MQSGVGVQVDGWGVARDQGAAAKGHGVDRI